MIIQKNVNLKKYNTFKVDCVAKLFVFVSNIEELKELIKTEEFMTNNRLIIGGGSNILIKNDFWDGMVVVNCIKGINIIESNENEVLVEVGAGENWHEFVLRSVNNNLGGIENLAFIPGTVGASPMQNIGAYGMEVKDSITNVEYVDMETGMTNVLTNEECNFGYRDSIFKNELKNKVMISKVYFKLYKINNNYKFKTEYADIQNKIQELGIKNEDINIRFLVDTIIDIRKNKLPNWQEIGTAGSFFKNPIIEIKQFEHISKSLPEIKGHNIQDDKVKLSAGQLIELSGLKGIGIGKIGTYRNHALVIINEGGSGQEILNFANMIIDKVFEKFGVKLEMEVNVY